MYRLDHSIFVRKPYPGDVWIERRLRYLAREHDRLHAGGISLHYWRAAEISYADFLATGDPKSRFHCWRSIAVASSWLAQVEAGKGAQ